MAEDGKQRRQKIRGRESAQGQRQHKCGMAELVESAAGDHAPDFGERTVRANAPGFGGEAQPDSTAALFDTAGQGAIVDQLAANGGYAAGPVESGRPDEDAAAGSSRHLETRVGDPRRRIEFE